MHQKGVWERAFDGGQEAEHKNRWRTSEGEEMRLTGLVIKTMLRMNGKRSRWAAKEATLLTAGVTLWLVGGISSNRHTHRSCEPDPVDRVILSQTFLVFMNHSLSGRRSLSSSAPGLLLHFSLSLSLCAHRNSLTDSHSCGWKAQANVQLLQMALHALPWKQLKARSI